GRDGTRRRRGRSFRRTSSPARARVTSKRSSASRRSSSTITWPTRPWCCVRGLPAGRGSGIDGGDGAHVGLELERVGDLGVAREHLGHPNKLYLKPEDRVEIW